MKQSSWSLLMAVTVISLVSVNCASVASDPQSPSTAAGCQVLTVSGSVQLYKYKPIDGQYVIDNDQTCNGMPVWFEPVGGNYFFLVQSFQYNKKFTVQSGWAIGPMACGSIVYAVNTASGASSTPNELSSGWYQFDPFNGRFFDNKDISAACSSGPVVPSVPERTSVIVSGSVDKTLNLDGEYHLVRNGHCFGHALYARRDRNGANYLFYVDSEQKYVQAKGYPYAAWAPNTGSGWAIGSKACAFPVYVASSQPVYSSPTDVASGSWLEIDPKGIYVNNPSLTVSSAPLQKPTNTEVQQETPVTSTRGDAFCARLTVSGSSEPSKRLDGVYRQVFTGNCYNWQFYAQDAIYGTNYIFYAYSPEEYAPNVLDLPFDNSYLPTTKSGWVIGSSVCELPVYAMNSNEGLYFNPDQVPTWLEMNPTTGKYVNNPNLSITCNRSP